MGVAAPSAGAGEPQGEHRRCTHQPHGGGLPARVRLPGRFGLQGERFRTSRPGRRARGVPCAGPGPLPARAAQRQRHACLAGDAPRRRPHARTGRAWPRRCPARRAAPPGRRLQQRRRRGGQLAEGGLQPHQGIRACHVPRHDPAVGVLDVHARSSAARRRTTAPAAGAMTRPGRSRRSRSRWSHRNWRPIAKAQSNSSGALDSAWPRYSSGRRRRRSGRHAPRQAR